MINSAKLRYFRQYENRDFMFLQGLVVIKGENEKGKSTLLEAIAYALFGTKALRDAIADAVTWEYPVSKLKVDVDFTIGKNTYRVVRKKSGAELFVDDKSQVTGHKEVTMAIEDIIGVTSKNAFNLLIAEQDSIRGAFKKGNTEATELIEKLADFDSIDKVVNSIQTELTTGSAVAVRERLSKAQTTLEECKVEKPDVAPVKSKIAESTKALKLAEMDKVEEGKLLVTLGKGLATAEERVSSVTRIKKQISDHEITLNSHNVRIEAHKLNKLPEAHELDKLEEWLVDLNRAKKRHLVYADLNKLPEYPEDYWDNDLPSLKDEMGAVKEKFQNTLVLVAELKAELKTAKDKFIIEGVCDKCNSIIGKTDEDHNALVEIEISDLEGKLISAEAERVELQEESCILEGVANSDAVFERFTLKHGEDASVTVDLNWVPRKVGWTGSIPEDSSNEIIEGAEQDIADVNKQTNDYHSAQAMIKQLEEQRVEYLGSIEEWQKELKRIPVVDLTKMKDSITEQEGVVVVINARIATSTEEVTLHQNSLTEMNRVYKAAVDAKAAAVQELADVNKELEDLEFNNDLLNAVRKAKPKIVDRLWATILHAVSSYFSTMRSRPSVVTKDSTGFRVDDKPSASLSGSAKDCLGIAIRVALSKTFLPHIPFIILDEPWASFDESRTEILVGFLLAAGFNQTIVVTHETLTEGSADQLIQI